jgi:superfamily II RNA helicase
VLGFEPDDWQLRLMRCVDSRRSALVCAPTSSGKSFVALYAIEHLLRATDEGVIVYVVPTRVLCQQVSMDIENRFSKEYKYPNRHMVGVFNREDTRNLSNCQVLVTVPECLEILLLKETALTKVSRGESVDGAQSKWWHFRLSYVLFDEVHNLGSNSTWESLLQLVSSPIIALSATVGNPESLRTWLQALEVRRREAHAAAYGLPPPPAYG